MESKFWGTVRGLINVRFPKQRKDQETHLTEEAELMQGQAAAPYSEVTRQKAFVIRTATAVAAVTAIPTTAVNLALYNNEPDGGRSYIIDEVWALVTVDAVATQKHAGIIACLGQTKVDPPTSPSTLIPRKMNGMGSPGGTNPGKIDTKSYTVTATTIDAVTGVAANWFPLGGTVTSAVVSLPNYAIRVPVEGRYMIPPGRWFAVHVLASVTTISAQMGIIWHEKILTLG